ncbi:MAG: type III secretion system gatekeeper subunit SctW [Pseudomonadota bacterium]
MDGINFDPRFDANKALANALEMQQAAQRAYTLPPTGRLSGQVLVLNKDTAFSVTNMAEEISFVRAEKVEQSRSTDERGIAQFEVYIPPMSEIEATLKAMQDEDAARGLKNLAKALVQIAAQRGDVLGEVGARFADPSKQYMLLAAAIHEAEQDPRARAEFERLRDAMALLQDRKDAAIRAGFNTIAVAAEFGATAEAADTFRAAYRDAVLGAASLASTFKQLLERFGDQRFESGVALLLKALAADLKAMRPSLEPVRLHAILQDVYQLQAAGTVLIRCRTLCDRLAREFLLILRAIDLTKDLVDMTTDMTPMPWTFAEMARRYRVTKKPKKDQEKGEQGRQNGKGRQEEDEPDEEEDEPLRENKLVAFLSGVMGALRAMPVKLFPSEDHRLNTIAAVQESLDKILLEDEPE